MNLTTQDLDALRRIALRAIDEVHYVLATAVSRQSREAARKATSLPAAPPELPKLKPQVAYSLKEASDLLGLSRSKLYSMISDGEIASVRIGSRRLIEASEIEALISRSRHPG